MPDLEAQKHAARGLVALASRELPLILSNDAPATARVAAGLLARILGTAEAAVCLTQLERRADLVVVVRCLFEHVAMLGWLTGPSDEAERLRRLGQWQIEDGIQRGRADVEVSTLIGRPLLNEEGRRIAEQARTSKRSGPTSLADRAKQADQEWSARLRFYTGGTDPSPLYSLRAVYSTLYRLASSMAHPTLAGLNGVSERTATHTVFQIEPRGDASPAFGMTVALLGTALYMSADVLGIPRISELNAIFDGLASSATTSRTA